MPEVAILYPDLFKCYSKFRRKILKIISNLDDVQLVFTFDHNGFIKKLADEKLLSSKKILTLEYYLNNITHAIIFDDGEEYSNELNIFQQSGIPVRLIHIPITRVINIKEDEKLKGVKSTNEYEYIGRGSYWGNPYSMYEEGESREEVIRKYKYDFDFDKFPNKKKDEVYKLAGKRLGCFCKPQACHGDVLADFLNSWDDGK